MCPGELVPDDQSRTNAQKLLVPGCVIKAFVKDTTPPKVKYYIVLGNINSGLLLASFYINSHMNGTIMRNPILSDLQHLIRKENHDFLTYDSYVDCSKLNQHDYNEVLRLVSLNPGIVVGHIIRDDFEIIVQMLKRSPNISNIHIRELGFNI